MLPIRLFFPRVPDTQQRALLVEAQMAWIKFRDDNVTFFSLHYPESKGGLFFKTHLTRERTAFLQSVLAAPPSKDLQGWEASGYRGDHWKSLGPAEFYWLMDRACASGDALGVQFLLKAGADPSGPRDFRVFRVRHNGFEPEWHLCQAARDGYTDIIRMLLQAGADPNLDPSSTVLKTEALNINGLRKHNGAVALHFPSAAYSTSWMVGGRAAPAARTAGRALPQS